MASRLRPSPSTSILTNGKIQATLSFPAKGRLKIACRGTETPDLQQSPGYFVTFFLIGLWHGQTSEFAVSGVLLGLGVSVNKLYQVEMAMRMGSRRYRALASHSLYRALSRELTFS